MKALWITLVLMLSPVWVPTLLWCCWVGFMFETALLRGWLGR
jgi:hypothetical protein